MLYIKNKFVVDMCKFKTLINFVSVFLLSLGLSSTSFADFPPVENFASLPDVISVKLSPDGKKVAALMRSSGEIDGTLLQVLYVDEGKSSAVVYTDNEKFVINWMDWINDENLFVSARFPAVRYGTPTTETRLLIADIKTNDLRGVISKRYYEKFDYMPQFQDDVVDYLIEDDEHFLFQVDGYKPTTPDVFKASVKSKKLRTVQTAEPKIREWMTDRQHNVRIGYYVNETNYKILHQLPGKSKRNTLWEFEAFSPEQVWPLGFDHDPNILYVRALHEGRFAVFSVDLSSENLERTLVYSSENYDVNGDLIYSSVVKKVIGIQTFDSKSYIFWDDHYKALFSGIDKALKDTSNIFLGMSRDERRYLIFSTNDVDAGTYYLGDRDIKSIQPIAYRYRKLVPEEMSKKQWIKYKARDGLEIEAAMTLPKNSDKKTKLPTIIFPHGGPIGNDGSGFDYWTQFFASRGYAVLQMNFRGSSGYGYDFMSAGLKNWGLAMQDDVADGAKWMIEQGYSDPEKICIVGASYGGYAALMGAIKTPELYKCVVSFAGISDLAYLVKSHHAYTNFERVKKQIGSDYKSLEHRSPLHLVKKLNTPTLLIHGSEDRSVKDWHSEKLHKAMVNHDKNVDYLLLEGGDHYLSNNEHRLATFKRMDAFLKKYLQ